MKNLFILMFVVSFFSVSTVFAEGEDMTNADGSYCAEGGKTSDSLEIKAEADSEDSGAIQES